MSKIISITFTITLFLISLNSYSQGYEIKVKIPQIKNQQLILGHYFTKQSMLIPDDTVMTDSKGVAVFKGKEKLPQGMYFMFLPNRRTFDILIPENQKFTVENDTLDLHENLKITGEKENLIFLEYQKFLKKQREKSSELTEKYKATSDQKEKKKLEAEFKKVNEEVNTKLEEIVSANPNYFFSKFLKATQEVKIPEELTDRDSKYYYYRGNYFNYFDYKDQRLLRTPIYESKIDYYLDKVIPQVPDTIIPIIDDMIKSSRKDKELFRFMLVHLFNKYTKSQIMGMENVMVHIAENYYIPEAEWSDKEFIEELKTKVQRKKPALIGNTAPDLSMIMLPKDPESVEAIKDAIQVMKEKGDAFLKDEKLIDEKIKLHKSNFPNLTDSALRSQVIISELAQFLEADLLSNFEGYIATNEQEAKYTILYFWEPDCSHCKEATPKFSKAYDEKELSNLVTVIPIYMQRNINEWEKYTKHLNTWIDFITKHNMLKWTNVWEPFGSSHYRDKFDISSSPVLYLLDKDKKVIAKRIGYEQAFDIIEELEKKEKGK